MTTPPPCLPSEWSVMPEQRRVTHLASGLILQFQPGLDGSGAMSVDTPNPDALPPATSPEEAARLVQAGWEAYARVAEMALASQVECDPQE
ncbi:MAG: hypothetical protein HQL96_03925 [Magnetococcales bacterium]|nr:hypothetical protein [Magnetococcales bacterium]